MKNKEKFADQIIKLAVNGEQIAFDTEKFEVVSCASIDCQICGFRSIDGKQRCCELSKKWAEEEYKDPCSEWANVLVDTPIWVKDCEGEKECPRHFAKFEDGYVYAWANGCTSFSSYSEPKKWNYARIAEGAEQCEPLK